MKKLFLTLLIILLNTGVISAKEIVVEVTPSAKITTGGKSLHEGDFVEFKVVKDNEKLKQDEIITGIVTKLEPNGFAGQQAGLSIEEFRVKKTREQLNGGIYLNGSAHNQIMEFKDNLLLPTMYIRGGEITLKPAKHVFFLYMEN